MEKFIEGIIPTDVISRDASIEMSFKPIPAYIARCKELGITRPKKSFYDPKIRSLLPWLARRSRSVARALNLAAILPKDTSNKQFLESLGFSKEKLQKLVSAGYPPLISYSEPDYDVALAKNITILDPMAGGGSIPLEAAILGTKVLVCDYNPVPFLILRATIEWPARYGHTLYQAVQKESQQLIEFAKSEFSTLYRKDDKGYIIARQVIDTSHIIPLSPSVIIHKTLEIHLEGNHTFISQTTKPNNKTKKVLLDQWIQQHKYLMTGNKEFLQTHHIVAIQEQKGFRPANSDDQELLYQSLDNISKLSLQLNTPLSSNNLLYRKILPLEKYLFLFNPRQLLVLEKLISYVQERTKILMNTDPEFGAAIATYLTFGLCKLADFNSILTSWNKNQKTIRDTLGSYYKFRELRLDPFYAESAVPYRTIEWIYEPNVQNKTSGGICPVLHELTRILSQVNWKNINIFLADVLQLSKHFYNKADIINVDPPYFDIHQYSDFSEFFWPILQVTLKNALPTLFENRILLDWTPGFSTVPRQHEMTGKTVKTIHEFSTKLTQALSEMKAALKEDGLLVFWFSHKDLTVWKAIAHAFRQNKFIIVNIIPLISEHPTRSSTMTKRHGTNRVLIIVARKKENAPYIDFTTIQNRFLQQLTKAKLFDKEIISEDEILFLKNVISILLNHE